jgi:hypothetical protein
LAGGYPKILSGRVFFTQSDFHFGSKRATIHLKRAAKRGDLAILAPVRFAVLNPAIGWGRFRDYMVEAHP